MVQLPAGAERLSLTEVAAAVVVVGLAAAAWAGLLGAQLGRFSEWLAIAVGVGAGLASLGLLWKAGGRPTFDGSDGLVLVLVVLGLWRVWPASVSWPVFLDPSWYANTALQIEATDGLAFPVPALADLPVDLRGVFVATFRDQAAVGLPFPDDTGQGFHAVGFAVRDVEVPQAGPYHPPLYSSWLALGARLAGTRGVALAVLPWVLAWWLAVGALARAVFGPLAAPVAVVLVALGPAAYFASQPFAEPAAAALVALGTWCLVRLSGGPPRPGWAAAAGLALGLALLVKVDAALALAAGGGWWLAARRRDRGWREGLALGAGLALPAVQWASLAAGASGLYVALNGGGVVRLVAGRAGWLALAATVAGTLLFAVLRARRARRLEEAQLRRGVGLVVAALVAAGLAAGWLAPAEGAPSMVMILAWLMTPLGLWAAVAGLVWALDAVAVRSGPVLAQALVAASVVLVAPVVSQAMSAPYMGRRLVPVALTMSAVLAGAAVAAWRWWWAERAVAGTAPPRWQAGAVVAAVALVGLGLLTNGEPLRRVAEFQGGEGLARRLVRPVGPEDILLFPATLHGADPGRMAAAVWSLAGRDTVVVGAPDRDPADVARAVDVWRAAGRGVWYVTDEAHAPPELPGYHLEYETEEAVVTYAVAPRPVLPPELMPVDLQLKLYAVLPAGE